MIGVYKIQSKVDNRYYIGSSNNMPKRWREHLYELTNNRHHNDYLQKFANKYGVDNLEFSIIEERGIDELLIREQYHLDLMPQDGFNICLSTASPMKNRKHTAKTLKKMCASQSKENNPMYGVKIPLERITAMQRGRALTRFSGNEKLKRLINLPRRVELSLIKGNWSMRFFSYAHARKFLGIQNTNIGKAKGLGSYS